MMEVVIEFNKSEHGAVGGSWREWVFQGDPAAEVTSRQVAGQVSYAEKEQSTKNLSGPYKLDRYMTHNYLINTFLY